MIHSFHTYSARAIPLMAFTAIALLGGCAIVDNDAPDIGDVEVRATGSSIVMSNGLDEAVYYFIIGRQASALINWAAGVHEDISVAPGKSVSVPYEDIYMDQSGETQIIAYWWTAMVREGKRVPGDIQWVVADL